MGIRFVAQLAHAKAAIIPAGMPPDSAFTHASPRIGEGFRAHRLRLEPQKNGTPAGRASQRGDIAVASLLRAAVRHNHSIPQPYSYVN